MKTLLVVVIVFLSAPTLASAQWIISHQFPGKTLRDIDFLDTNTGWILSSEDTIFRTTDAGSSWFAYFIDTAETPLSVKFVSSTTGMIVGTSGLVWRTTTGGEAWSSRPTNVTSTLQRIEYLYDNGFKTWCVGNGGTIIHSNDRGTSWSTQASGGVNLYGVDFLDKSIGWAVGSGGRILHTTDGGASWNPQSSPAGDAGLYDVYFVSSTRGWMVGASGSIITTGTGGTSWMLQTSGVSDNLFGVSFLDGSQGVAVGINGTILHTTNGGVTWAPEQTNPPSESEFYYKVFYQDLENCWIISRDTGNLLYSQGSLRVTYPNDGGVIEGGRQDSITWNSAYVDKITIEFTTDNGSSWSYAGAGAQSWDAATGAYSWNVPNDVNSKNCRIRLTAITKAGLMDESNQNFEIYVSDATPPEIVTTPVAESLQDQDIVISAVITDASGIQEAKLHHRLAGEQMFKQVDMVNTVGSTFEGTIPWQSDGIRGYQYYIRAVDGSFAQNDTTLPPLNPQAHPFFITIRVTDVSRSIESSIPENTTYQMISIPLEYEMNAGSVDAILVDDMGTYDRRNWAFFRWITENKQNSEYTKAAIGDFSPGKAFWIASRKSGYDISSGLSVTPEFFTIDLSPSATNDPLSGWHQIANPFAFVVSWDDILATNGDPAGWDTPHFYNPQTKGYEPATVLEPWTGYFFKNPAQSAASLVIPPSESATSLVCGRASILPSSGPDNWALQLVVSCSGASDYFNYAGVSASASLNRDKYDHLQPPAIGDFISLYFPHADWKEYPDFYTTDFRPPFEDGEEWELLVRSNLPAAEAMITINHVESVPADFDIYLFDAQFEVAQNLRDNRTYRFPVPSAKQGKPLTLVVGRDEFFNGSNLSRRNAPLKFSVEQNFPNPFNSSTYIRYILDAPGRVSLTIYSVRGERVAQLLQNEDKQPGHHVAVWHGMDAAGNNVASGVYLYRLTVGSSSTAKRMVLLR